MPITEASQAILLVLESIFPSPAGGGAESQVRTLGLEFLRRHQALEVVVPMVAGGPQRRFELVDGIPVTRIPYPKVPWIGAFLMLVRLSWLLLKRRSSYDVIHVHIAGNMAAISSLIGRLLGKPVVVKLTGMTEMKGGILDPMPRLGARLRKAVMHLASGYQATSQRIADLLAVRGFARERILQVPNAVDVQRFSSVPRDAARRRAVCGDRQLIGVYVGRLEPEKGLELLIQGWARVFRHRTDVALMLVGDGSLFDSLRNGARELDIDSQIIFVGSTEQVERYLALADFGVLTSLYEGLSNSLLEYMAAGLPVVGSRVSGTEDWVIDGRTGWLFPPGNLEAFATALARVGDPDTQTLRAHGATAQQLVIDKASIPAVVDVLQATYRRLDAERSGAHREASSRRA
jgi:glycosyltransferase involved in cell wall biosynthesis